jgi:adenosine deaminase
MKNLIQKLPKAELHLHIEGTLEPELMFKLAKRNGVNIPYKSIDEVKQAYNFTSLQSFLDIYYAGANVLITEQDFFDLTWGYLLTCKAQNIVHTEIMFDPQTHTSRGIEFRTVIMGITKALKKAEEELRISSFLIMSFLRHLSEEAAIATLESSLAYKHLIKAVGLDSSEVGNPPSKFEKVFKMSKNAGYKLVAHGGEEGDCSYIWGALNLLHVDRIDHGIKCDEDEKLIEYLKQNKIPLTVCPLSNVKLKAVDDMSNHNILKLLKKGLLVTVNSDDPSYFGGYLNTNFKAMVADLEINREEITQLIKNSFIASFLDDEIKLEYLKKCDL